MGSVLFAGQRREASALVNKNAFIGFVAGLGWAPTDGHQQMVWFQGGTKVQSGHMPTDQFWPVTLYLAPRVGAHC